MSRYRLTAVAALALLLIGLLSGCDKKAKLGTAPQIAQPLPPGIPQSWQNLKLSTSYVHVYALGSWNGKLIAGGSFFNVNGSNPSTALASWDGTGWTRMGPQFGSDVRAITVRNGRLVVGGVFEHINGDTLRHIAEWDGAAWIPLGSGIHGEVSALADYGDTLVSGGSYPGNVSRWNGSSWAPMDSLDGRVEALTVHDGTLVAGGYFHESLKALENGIARWVK